MAQPSQLIFPRLDLQILTSVVDAETGYVQGTICQDDPTWTKGPHTCKEYSMETHNCSDVGDQGISASEACKVACNTCPKDVKIQRDIGRTYNRLPSPVEDTLEPSYSSLLQDNNWHMGDMNDASRSPELYDKLDELEEKIDNVRKSMVSMKCLCSDIKDDGIKPYRCGEVSNEMVWGDVLTWTDVDSKDTDVRYPVKCQKGADYADPLLNPTLAGLELVYNCTSQDWETRKVGPRKTPFTTFDFKSTVVRCEPLPAKGPAQNPKGPAQNPKGPAQNPKGPAQTPKGPAQTPKGPAQTPKGPAQNPKGPAQNPKGPAQGPDILKHITPLGSTWWKVQLLYTGCVCVIMGILYPMLGKYPAVWTRKALALLVVAPVMFWILYYTRKSQNFTQWTMIGMSLMVLGGMIFYFRRLSTLDIDMSRIFP
jgi:hypothetical protein